MFAPPVFKIEEHYAVKSRESVGRGKKIYQAETLAAGKPVRITQLVKAKDREELNEVRDQVDLLRLINHPCVAEQVALH